MADKYEVDDTGSDGEANPSSGAGAAAPARDDEEGDMGARKPTAQAWDADGDGTLDDTEQQMAAWDVDGDGKLSTAEMAMAANQHNQSKHQVAQLKKMVCVILMASLLMFCALLGLAWLANEWSKDSRPQGGVLTDNDGNIVSTSIALGNVPLVEFPAQPLKILRAVLDIVVPHGDEVLFYKIASWRWVDTTRMVLYSFTGDTVEVDGDAITIVEAGGSVISVSGVTVGRGRSLASIDVPRVYYQRS